jgi:hypothetical protein
MLLFHDDFLIEMRGTDIVSGADHHQPSVRCAAKRRSEGPRSNDGGPGINPMIDPRSAPGNLKAILGARACGRSSLSRAHILARGICFPENAFLAAIR